MTIKTISLNEAIITKLEEKGNRWTKGNFDRIYFDVSDVTSFSYTTYNSGNISSAELGGEEISNAEAGRISCAKLYVDLKTGDVVVENKGNARKISRIADEFMAAIEAMVAETEEKAEEEAQETEESAEVIADYEMTVKVQFTDRTALRDAAGELAANGWTAEDRDELLERQIEDATRKAADVGHTLTEEDLAEIVEGFNYMMEHICA